MKNYKLYHIKTNTLYYNLLIKLLQNIKKYFKKLVNKKIIINKYLFGSI